MFHAVIENVKILLRQIKHNFASFVEDSGRSWYEPEFILHRRCFDFRTVHNEQALRRPFELAAHIVGA